MDKYAKSNEGKEDTDAYTEKMDELQKDMKEAEGEEKEQLEELDTQLDEVNEAYAEAAKEHDKLSDPKKLEKSIRLKAELEQKQIYDTNKLGNLRKDLREVQDKLEKIETRITNVSL